LDLRRRPGSRQQQHPHGDEPGMTKHPVRPGPFGTRPQDPRDGDDAEDDQSDHGDDGTETHRTRLRPAANDVATPTPATAIHAPGSSSTTTSGGVSSMRAASWDRMSETIPSTRSTSSNCQYRP